MKIHSYLNFENTTEKAFRFYEKVLGGKLTEVYRFGAMPSEGGFELTPEQKNLVMHVGLQLPDGQMIMGSDMLPGMGPKRVEGNNFSISVHPDSRQEAVERLIEEARSKGADAIIAMRFDASELGTNWTEICAYGTAVRLTKI